MILSGIRSEVSKGVLLLAATFLALVLACPTTARAQAGTPIWTNHYNGPGNNDDSPVAVATDNNGNTFVTGSSVGTGSIYAFATIKYSSGGVPMWTNRYSGPNNSGALAVAMGLDTNGNVFVTGSAASDCITIKYANAGVPLWTNRYNSPFNNDDAPSALAVDTNGNIWVTGHSVGLIGYDFLTLGYSNNGAPLWVNRYSPLPDFGDDSATAIAVDTNGRVIVTGYSLGTTGTDFATVAYSKTGAPLWTNRYEGPLSANEQAVAVGVNRNGTVFVTGTGDDDYVTLGYTNNGAPYWTNRYDSNPPGGIDRASALVVDGNGDVIVTGFSVAGYLTIKFASNGVPIWTNSYFGPFGYPAEPAAIGVDSSNNVFVTGRSWSATFTYYEFATQAYSSDGTPMWTRRYNTPGNFSDQAVALAVDRFGNVSVTGISTGGGGAGTPDYSTVKYLTAIPPTSIPINIQLSGNKIILSWDNSGMKLQSAPAANGPYNDVPGAMSPYSANIAGNQQFFRLVPR